MPLFKIALLAWLIAIAGGLAWAAYRGDFARAPEPGQRPRIVHDLDDVIACRAREDAERLAVAFNKTTELAKALEDPKSEAGAVSRRLLIGGRCAHFEHRVRFEAVAMPFDGSTFAPVRPKPFNVIEADVTLIEGSGRFFLVTDWRLMT